MISLMKFVHVKITFSGPENPSPYSKTTIAILDAFLPVLSTNSSNPLNGYSSNASKVLSFLLINKKQNIQ